jgi:hypothetical protein
VSTPEASPEDVQEQQAALVAEPEGEQPDVPAEATAADAAEQRARPAGSAAGDDDIPVEAPAADVVEQRIEVPLDEDDAPIG